MPETKSEPKSILNRYAHDFFSLVFSELSEKAERLIKRLGEFVILRKILKQYAIFWVMMLAAIVTTLYGLGAFIGSFFPGLKPGLSHIFIGAALAATAIAYRRFKGGSN